MGRGHVDESICSYKMEAVVKKVFTIVFLCLGLTYFCAGWAQAAGQIDLTGTWVGIAEGASDDNFYKQKMTLVVTKHQGKAFYGTMSFKNGEPFSVNGVLFQDTIRITGSFSTFFGVLQSGSTKKQIVGTASRFEGKGVERATIFFELTK